MKVNKSMCHIQMLFKLIVGPLLLAVVLAVEPGNASLHSLKQGQGCSAAEDKGGENKGVGSAVGVQVGNKVGRPMVEMSCKKVDDKTHTIGELVVETGFYQSLEIVGEAPIYSAHSKYQHIEVYESSHYGKILVLDGVLQLTERDADSYNEMMAHVPLFEHPAPKRILVVGGGDGYILHEALKHSSVLQADHVDLDGAVIDACRRHFKWGAVWSDPRVSLHVADGAAFVRDAPEGYYDVIIQDSSDPYTWGDNGEKRVLPSSTLYDQEHFNNLFRILSKDGILNIQAESFQIPSDLEDIADWRQSTLDVGFQDVKYGSISISTYPTGQIGFLLSKKNKNIAASMEEVYGRFQLMEQGGNITRYYQPKLQTSCFDLPLWVERGIYKNSTVETLTI